MQARIDSTKKERKMTREQAIQEIEGLFPADSQYPKSREKGIELLEQAKRNTNNWRNLPDETLFEYARLCRLTNRHSVKATIYKK
jgi:hypothetical protein